MEKPSILFPCEMEWSSMKQIGKKRYCEHCRKNIIDFSNMSEVEILSYFEKLNNDITCGRFLESQLNKDEISPIEVRGFDNRKTSKSISYPVLAMSTIILFSCGEDQISKDNNKDVQSSYSINLDSEYCDSTNTFADDSEVDRKQLHFIGKVVKPQFDLGKMPEFKGGVESLHKFVEQNIKYPEWEKENRIQGTVMLRLNIDQNGKIENFEITKTISGSKNLENEVKRMVELMPDWIPAKNKHDEDVSAYVIMPIKFKLD